jgi:predicted DNA-binding ribbon-helix-helix protein
VARKRTTLYFEEETYLKLKALALSRNTTMTTIVTELLEAAPEPRGRWVKEWRAAQQKGKPKK